MPGVNPTQDLFGEDLFPEGLNYHPDFLRHEEEQALLRHIERLPLNEFEFHGKFFEEAERLGLEGIMAKRATGIPSPRPSSFRALPVLCASIRMSVTQLRIIC